MIKRIERFFCMMVSALLMCPVQGVAGAIISAKTVEGVEMRFEIMDEQEKTCAVKGTSYYENNPAIDKETAGPLTIPAEVNGYKVEAIMERAFFNCKNLTSVFVPDCVMSLGSDVFDKCSSLESVHLGSGVTWLGDNCFAGCSKLATVNFPSSLENIGESCFAGTALTSVVLGDNIIELDKYCFNGCTSLTSVVFGKSPIVVRDLTFWECTSLSSVDLGGVSGIESSAFGRCPSLMSLFIPKTVTQIEKGFFYEGNYLRRLSVEAGNPVYDSRGDCNAVIETATNTLVLGCATTVIPNSVTTIGWDAFKSSQLRSIVIPQGVTCIDFQAFDECPELLVVTVPESVTSMGTYSMTGCEKMRSLAMYIEDPETTDLSQWTFKGSVENAVIWVKPGMRDAYMRINSGCFDGAYIREMKDAEVTLDSEMMAFANPYGLDFTTPIEGLKAYRIKNVNGSGQAVLEEVNTLVPAGEGLILKGTAGETYTIPYAQTSPAYLSNKLRGTLDEEPVGSDGCDYVFADGKFVKADATTLGKGVAYLHLDVAIDATTIDIVEGINPKECDLNGDGKLTEEDVVMAIDVLAGIVTDEKTKAAADVNKDGKVDVADVVALANLIIGK